MSDVPLRRAEVSSLTKIGGGGHVLIAFNAAVKPPKWKSHPWRTVPSWNPQMGRWEVRIYPGFVNGLDPTCFGYLDSDNFEARAKPRQLDLFDLPYIPINSMRSIDGLTEKILPFFAEKGVRKQLDIAISGEKIVINETPDDPNLPPLRALMAVDFWVAVSRPTYQSNVTVSGNLVTGQIVDYAISFDDSTLQLYGERARLMQGPKFPDKKDVSLSDRLSGLYEDDGEDRLPISTVYFLSPPNKLQGPVNADWSAYVQHRCFWNPLHAARNDPPKNTKQTTVDSGLAAFLGRYTVAPQATIGLMEAESQRILAAVLNNTSNEGKFWTI